MYKYDYVKASVNLSKLQDEIKADPVISQDADHCNWNAPESLETFFENELTGGEQTALQTLVTNHDPTPPFVAPDVPENYFCGLGITINATNPTYQIDIEKGECRGVCATCTLQVDFAITVDITQSGVNGLDTGSETISAWYYVWLIRNPATGNVAGLLSTSHADPTLPNGYTQKRRIGSIRNDLNGNFLDFFQSADGASKIYRYRDAQVSGVLSGGNATSFTDVDLSAFVPPTSRYVFLNLDTVNSAAVGITELRENGTTGNYSVKSAVYERGSMSCFISTDTNQIIEYKVNDAAASASIEVEGYKEVTG